MRALISRAHCKLCQWLCGHMDDDLRTKVPQKIRDASHDLSNETMILKGAARRMKEEVDVLDQMARTIKTRGLENDERNDERDDDAAKAGVRGKP